MNQTNHITDIKMRAEACIFFCVFIVVFIDGASLPTNGACVNKLTRYYIKE